MSLGTRQLTMTIAAIVCVTGLAACGSDEPSDPAASTSSSTSAATESTESASEEPSTSESTPSVEPATGLKLKHDLAEITMPVGWKPKNNFGVPFIRQGSDNLFGTLTFSELGGEDDQATSLDAIARRQLRLVGNPRLKRLDDVIIGGDTNAYRLAGRENKYFYEQYYGVLIGNFEYTLAFSFSTEYGTIADAEGLMESMLATWDFNP